MQNFGREIKINTTFLLYHSKDLISEISFPSFNLVVFILEEAGGVKEEENMQTSAVIP